MIEESFLSPLTLEIIAIWRKTNGEYILICPERALTFDNSRLSFERLAQPVFFVRSKGNGRYFCGEDALIANPVAEFLRGLQTIAFKVLSRNFFRRR